MRETIYILILLTVLAFWRNEVSMTDAIKTSGFYFDNGMDQTEIEFMDQEDQEILREEILTLLGLTHAPKNVVHKVELGNHTVPHFMKDIYNSLTSDNSESGEMRPHIDTEKLLNTKYGITINDVKFINESDIIMSFANRGHQEDLQWTQLFWFDTNELPDSQEQELIRAELRMYKSKANSEFDPEEKFVVRCFQLVEGETGKANMLDSITLSFKDQGWFNLDLTRAVKSWQLDYHTNQGLMVEIIRENAERQLHPLAVGLTTNRDYLPDKESFMVAYFKTRPGLDQFYNRYRFKRDVERSYDSGDHDLESKASLRRSKRSNKRKTKYSNLEENFGTSSIDPLRDYYGGKHKYRHCKIRMFRVSFRDLGWQDWIIAPDDYQAFYCHGECSFPLNTHMNATNHAIVQTLIHLMNPHSVPKPSCAPTQLAAINVLYFDESSNVILKKYQNMVVKSCGCH